MSKKLRWIKLGYIIIGLIHLTSISVHIGQVWISDWAYGLSKLALMPVLMILAYNYLKTFRHNSKKWKTVILALFFSFLGDFFLLDFFQGQKYFLAGLVCFLITHLLYIRLFIRGKIATIRWDTVPVKVLLVFIFIWTAWYYTILLPELGTLLPAVSIYIIVIAAMAISAVLRHGYAYRASYNYVLIGALAFMLSDSFVAWRIFLYDFNDAGIIVMSSYMLAQYYIVEGLYRQDLAAGE